jgi:triphosphoribosyl-dephospho-CoA synthase
MESNELAVSRTDAVARCRTSIGPACVSIEEVRRSRTASRATLKALHDELCLYPKPGLVSRIDSGSHRDMTAALFVRSLFSLRHYFSAVYLAGVRNAPFAVLRLLGMDAEARMLRATSGVNTHRGAIFNLGILCAMIGKWDADGRKTELSRLDVDDWASAIKAADSNLSGTSNGGWACRIYAVGGARGEAAAGFPHVFRVGLPALNAARAAGADEAAAAVHAFFAVMASLQDTNLLHRGGAGGLAYAKSAAASFLADGGVLSCGWRERAVLIHQEFVQRHLSPGGSADLLAATLFVDRMTRDAVNG